MNGLAPAPKGTRVSRKCCFCPFTLNRKGKTCLFSCFIPMCRNAFSMSLSRISVDILALWSSVHGVIDTLRIVIIFPFKSA